MLESPIFYIILFSLGLIWGSFLNVCIIRLPQGRSIIYPFSQCLACGKRIAFYDNIPILSYLILRGRCRHCRERISLQYPLVEILLGSFTILIWLNFGLAPLALIYYFLISVLVFVTLVDFRYRIIPDYLTIPGILTGFLLSFYFLPIQWHESLLGIVLGMGGLILIAYLYYWLAGKEGLGGGDVKFLGMLGAFFGIKGVLFIMFFSAIFGSLIGLFLVAFFKKSTKYALPYGPFMAAAAFIYLFWGPFIISWYLPSY